MEVILENEANLNIQWHPGCHFGSHVPENPAPEHITMPLDLHRCALGPIGSAGSSGLEEPSKKEPPKKEPPTVPKSLQLWMHPKSPHYGLIVEALVALQREGDTIDVIVSPPRPQITLGDILPEKAAEAQMIKSANAKIMVRYWELVSELSTMGIDEDDIPGPMLKKIPPEFYVQTTDEIDGRIEVRCHENTKFYQFFQEHGLFEKYFPQWYRDGRY